MLSFRNAHLIKILVLSITISGFAGNVSAGKGKSVVTTSDVAQLVLCGGILVVAFGANRYYASEEACIAAEIVEMASEEERKEALSRLSSAKRKKVIALVLALGCGAGLAVKTILLVKKTNEKKKNKSKKINANEPRTITDPNEIKRWWTDEGKLDEKKS